MSRQCVCWYLNVKQNKSEIYLYLTKKTLVTCKRFTDANFVQPKKLVYHDFASIYYFWTTFFRQLRDILLLCPHSLKPIFWLLIKIFTIYTPNRQEYLKTCEIKQICPFILNSWKTRKKSLSMKYLPLSLLLKQLKAVNKIWEICMKEVPKKLHRYENSLSNSKRTDWVLKSYEQKQINSGLILIHCVVLKVQNKVKVLLIWLKCFLIAKCVSSLLVQYPTVQ